MTLLQHHVLVDGITSATSIGLGLLVLFSGFHRKLNRVFAIYSLTIAWWAFGEMFYIRAPNVESAAEILRIVWIGISFIAPCFLHTVLLLTKSENQREWFTLRFGYWTGFLFSVFQLWPNVVTSLPRAVAYTSFFAALTPLGYCLPAVFLFLVNIGLWRLWVTYRYSQGSQKIQIKYLFWSSLFGYLGGGFDWCLTFGIYVPYMNPFGIYTVPLYSIATAYAVLQHKLFDVHLVIRKSLVYSILVTFLTAGYFAFVYSIERLSQITFGYQSRWLSLAAFALMTFFFQPLKIGIQRLVDWLIFRAPQQELVRRMEKLEQEARQTEKLKAVSTLAAGLCHELRNPLQTIRTHAEFLSERYDDPGFRDQCADVMRTEIGRIDEFLKQLMEFAKPKLPAIRQLEPHKIIDSTLDLLSNEFVRRGVQLDKDYQANGLQLRADPDQIRQIILNLTLNALEAIGQKGEVAVRTNRENGWFILEISDTGPGIDPKILPKLFEPFSTTKPDGNGLGLSIVHSIMREHHGKILVQSQPGQGTAFVLKFPVS